jgi:hypothetical protein
LRRADAAGFGGAGLALGVHGGVVRHADTSLEVTVDGSDVVTVQPGAVVIPGNAVSGTGCYRGALSTATTGSLTARNATNGRIDLVVFRAMDTDVVPGHGAYTGRIEVIAGTPSATPAVPTFPSMAVELARISVPNTGGGAATVDSSYRTYAYAVGGIMVAPASARLPADAPLWQRAVALDTGYEWRFDGTNWVARDGAWTNLTKAAVMTSGTLRYRVKSGMVTVQVDGSATIADGATATLTASAIPTALRPGTQFRSGAYLGGFAGSLTVQTDGNVTATNNTGASRGSVAGTITYPVE